MLLELELELEGVGSDFFLHDAIPMQTNKISNIPEKRFVDDFINNLFKFLMENIKIKIFNLKIDFNTSYYVLLKEKINGKSGK